MTDPNAPAPATPTDTPKEPPPSKNDSAHNSLEERVRQQETELARLRRRDRIHDAVGRASVIDPGAACLLVERALDDDADASIDDTLNRLRSERPWLFPTEHSPSVHGAAAPRSTAPTHSSLERAARSIDEAATRARTTGNTTDLLTYLRLKDAR